jgi:hypothetical protein
MNAVSEPRRNDRDELARRNLRTALWLALMALGFVAAFVWSMSHRGG